MNGLSFLSRCLAPFDNEHSMANVLPAASPFKFHEINNHQIIIARTFYHFNKCLVWIQQNIHSIECEMWWSWLLPHLAQHFNQHTRIQAHKISSSKTRTCSIPSKFSIWNVAFFFFRPFHSYSCLFEFSTWNWFSNLRNK